MFAKTLRNTLIASTLVIAGSVLANPAMALTEGDIPLGGTVNSTLSLEISPTDDNATTLPLDGEAANNPQVVPIATLTMHTNNDTGYTLTANQGSLSKDGGVAIPYQVLVTTTAEQPAAGAFLTPTGTNYTYVTAVANDATTGGRWLSILYTPAAMQDPGEYSGNINLVITDNN